MGAFTGFQLDGLPGAAVGFLAPRAADYPGDKVLQRSIEKYSKDWAHPLAMNPILPTMPLSGWAGQAAVVPDDSPDFGF